MDTFELPRFLSFRLSPQMPTWSRGLTLRARVIDFGVGSATGHIATWLRRVGFTVVYTRYGSNGNQRQLSNACCFVATQCMADLYVAGSDWSTVNVDCAIDEGVIHKVSEILVTNGIRQEPVVLPLMSAGVITTAEACAAAAILADQQAGGVHRLAQSAVGHLPQDLIAHIANAMYRVSSGAPGISDAAPEIQFAQGNLRELESRAIGCHAIVVAFSIERACL